MDVSAGKYGIGAARSGVAQRARLRAQGVRVGMTFSLVFVGG